jgi:acyl-coenzyme A synthetase/AMP-(fatty) acid ligase
VIFAGEAYPTPKLRELLKRIPGRSPWNLYGPTETNVCTYYRVVDVPPDDDRPIPIGRACENTDVFAVADDGSRAEVGEVGELYVRGSTVMKGYWGRPDVTGGVLVDHPLDPTLPERVYRTGDLVRPRPDGDYDFLGRRDHQIKSRGYRIELGEIEAALATHPAVEDAVCVAVPHPEWDKEIASRVVLRQGLDTDPMSLKRHLSERIPRYMIPTRIEFAETLPRTPNGKIDRRRVADEMASR